jgi:membrane protease YdiL (CAAX protease family)
MPDQTIAIAENQPRYSLWQKICSFAIVRIVLGLMIVVVTLTALQFGFRAAAASSPGLKHFFAATSLPALAGILAVLFAYTLFVRWIERRRAAELGRSGAIVESAAGIGLGALMFAVTIGILALLGVFRVNGFNAWSVLIAAAAGAAISAVLEEVIFRGIIFRITEQSLGTWFAPGISALLFGAVHLLNPHTSVQGGIAIVLEAGIFLAAAFMTTRRLWLAIGAHFGWNFTESGIFGVADSGNASHGLINGTVTGPVYLSGGIFGVEASVVAIGVCLAVALVLLARARAKDQFIAPFWRR